MVIADGCPVHVQLGHACDTVVTCSLAPLDIPTGLECIATAVIGNQAGLTGRENLHMARIMHQPVA